MPNLKLTAGLSDQVVRPVVNIDKILSTWVENIARSAPAQQGPLLTEKEYGSSGVSSDMVKGIYDSNHMAYEITNEVRT